MSAITNVGCVLTQEALDAFCNTFHIPEEVHPVLPNQDDTIHERPGGKIRLYIRFFDFANFRFPLSTFLVDILRHFRINISQLSVIRAAKKFSKAFLCLIGLSRHYTLDEETYPRFVHQNGEDMDLFAFIHSLDPTKVRVVERERDVDEPRILDTTVGHTVPLLLVTPDCADNELEASVERLFDKGSNGPVRLKSQMKRKSVAVDAGGASHPLKKLRGNHETPSGTSVGASVSTTLEREDEDHMDSVTKPDLCTIGAPKRFVISSDYSHHSGPTIAKAEVDSLVRSSTPVMTTATTVTFTVHSTLVVKEKPIKPYLLVADSSSASEADPNTSIFSDLTGIDFLSCHQMHLSAEVRMYAEYNVKENRRLKYVVEKQDELLKARDGEIENLLAQLLLREVEATEAIHLHAQTSNLEAVEKSLRDEVNALKGRNVILKKERYALDVKVTDLETSVVGKERDLTDLNAQLTSVKSQNDSLTDQVHELEVSSAELQKKITVFDNCMEQLEKLQDDRMKVVSEKLAKLDSDLTKMACHLEEKFYPRLLNAISGRRRAIKKGMHSSLVADINHRREGMSLADVAAYNPDAEADLNTVLQELRVVDFPLLAELKSYKDASMEDIMNVLLLKGALADAPRMNDLQPNVEAQRSTLVGVWTPLSKPLFVTSLMGEASTSSVVPTASVTTNALSTTFASASSIPPISIDYYEIVGVDGQEGAGTDG
nr:transposase (putative), gypsy type [Tanacetum cinerariifolium]